MGYIMGLGIKSCPRVYVRSLKVLKLAFYSVELSGGLGFMKQEFCQGFY